MKSIARGNEACEIELKGMPGQMHVSGQKKRKTEQSLNRRNHYFADGGG